MEGEGEEGEEVRERGSRRILARSGHKRGVLEPGKTVTLSQGVRIFSNISVLIRK